MKKQQQEPKIQQKRQEIKEKADIHPPDSDEEEGFSKWLRSNEGVENLKLFVIGNSALIFLLVSWPQVKEALETAYYMYIKYRNSN
ncbi:hypothetical protein BDFB_000577 [Asbolus verrucosus]|uniref:Uncharacterized protein n=1 Tax=Asbolus verrucosus TaxID=1661398 RepID=A0A482VSG4_ASBVE|nr:hypothetical protein BDFB_000577 [Asbolus verrucosus]